MKAQVLEFGNSALRRRVRQLELRLQEANHRVANSLQLVSSLADHEARAVMDPTARLRLASTRRHIQAVAHVHRMLSVDVEAETLPLQDYLSEVAAGLQAIVAGGGRTRIISATCDPYQVTPEVAVCLGMIVNELVSNACKYAYDADACGEVRVRFAGQVGSGFTLTIEDDGRGLYASGRSRELGIGMRMVHAMARRVGAEFRFVAGGCGARAIVSREDRSMS